MSAQLRLASVINSPQHQYATAIVIAASLQIDVRKQEDGEDYTNSIPAREDETARVSCVSSEQSFRCRNIRECAMYHALLANAIYEGKEYHGRNLKQADLKCVRGPDFHTVVCISLPPDAGIAGESRTHLRAMFPFMANAMAFMNSVVFGTKAKRVTPRNFSGIPDPSRTTSTTSTRISVEV